MLPVNSPFYFFARCFSRWTPIITERTEEANVSLENVDPRIKGAYSNCFNCMIHFFFDYLEEEW